MKKLNPKKVTIAAVLTFLMLSTFILAQPALAQPQSSNPQDITVQQAKHMIKHTPDVVILDVRNESEYKLGHLYNAILIPLHELEARINELADNQNDKIIVYCKAGSRSAPACQILANHSFTKIYNMAGGIDAWMQADYPLSTTYHYVTVSATENIRRAQIDIDPLLLYQTGCTTCNQSSTCSIGNVPNGTVTVLENSENHVVLLMSYEANGTIVEYTIDKTLLWRQSELTEDLNRTITFISTNITLDNFSMQVYGLADYVVSPQYNVTLITGLVPLDENTYNASTTSINYSPTGKTEIVSLEKVKFNNSVTLSEQYTLLSKVTKKIGNEYEKSLDQNITAFAERYYTMAAEFKLLATIVKNDLTNYDHEILNNTATIMDDSTSCLACMLGCEAALAGGCVAVCIFTLLLACSICLDFWFAIDLIGGMGCTAACEGADWCP